MWLKDANQFMSNKELYSVQPVRSGSKLWGIHSSLLQPRPVEDLDSFDLLPHLGVTLPNSIVKQKEGMKVCVYVCVCVCVCVCQYKYTNASISTCISTACRQACVYLSSTLYGSCRQNGQQCTLSS